MSRVRPLSLFILYSACSADPTSTADPTLEPVSTSTVTEPAESGTTQPSEPPTTSGLSTDESSGADTGSSGGQPSVACTSIHSMRACNATDACTWGTLTNEVLSASGCFSQDLEFCLPKDTAGEPSSWYYDEGDMDTAVFDFPYTPTDLGPEWKPCDCDGPLACLCAKNPPDCPERHEEFCGYAQSDDGCAKTTIKGKAVCDWFRVAPEGPADDKCDDEPYDELCLPAEKGNTTLCEQTPLPPFNACPEGIPKDPVFWRNNQGVIEVTSACGPIPLGFTRCEPEDTPAQPDECTCLCL